jgi:hypothetical protein
METNSKREFDMMVGYSNQEQTTSLMSFLYDSEHRIQTLYQQWSAFSQEFESVQEHIFAHTVAQNNAYKPSLHTFNFVHKHVKELTSYAAGKLQLRSNQRGLGLRVYKLLNSNENCKTLPTMTSTCYQKFIF